jgi:hypothetical protein
VGLFVPLDRAGEHRDLVGERAADLLEARASTLHELDVRHELPDDFSFDGAVEAARRGLRHLRVA